MHEYYKTAVDVISEKDVLQKILSDSLDDNYMPWSGPGLDVEGPHGWVWLKVEKRGEYIFIHGLHGEHVFVLTNDERTFRPWL